MRRPTFPALVIAVGVLLLADLLVVNQSLGDLAGLLVDAAILVAAGAALAGLGLARGASRRATCGDGAATRSGPASCSRAWPSSSSPGSGRAPRARPTRPSRWLVSALMLPIGATLFGLLFVTTLTAARRSLEDRRSRGDGRSSARRSSCSSCSCRSPAPPATALARAAEWALDVPIGAVFRGILIGVGVLVAVFAARTLLGIGSTDE